MKLVSLIDEKFGIPSNAGRDFGEKFMKGLIGSGKFAELWTAFEASYPDLQPYLQASFEKSNELLRYIKPELGDETYSVSKMDDVAAQELNNLLHNILETLEFISRQNEQPSEEMAKAVIKDFDNIFEDMLNIFTSNTSPDKPLEPYQQSDIGFRINEEEDVYADLNRFRDQIELQEGPHTFKMLQSELMKGKEAFVENWLAEHGYIDRKPTPFEEEFLREQIRNTIKSLKTS